MTGENTTRRRILVVDDEADFAELVGAVLRHEGYDVDVALNGKPDWRPCASTHQT